MQFTRITKQVPTSFIRIDDIDLEESKLRHILERMIDGPAKDYEIDKETAENLVKLGYLSKSIYDYTNNINLYRVANYEKCGMLHKAIYSDKDITNIEPKTLQYDCTNPANEDELNYIINNMSPIALTEFRANVDTSSFSALEKELGYASDFPIEKDWHVNYGKCYLPARKTTAYILIHSCIEYVFY